MAVGNPYIQCDTSGMNLETLMKALAVRDVTTKKEGIRTLTVTVAAAADIEPAVDCNNSAQGIEAHFRNMIYKDGDGQPALLLYIVNAL